MRNYEREIYLVMVDLSANQGIKGYNYACFLIKKLLEEDAIGRYRVMDLYNAVCDKFKDTPSRVERALRHFIERIFNNASPEKIKKYFGENAVPFEKDKLPNGQFIYSLVNYLRVNMVI